MCNADRPTTCPSLGGSPAFYTPPQPRVPFFRASPGDRVWIPDTGQEGSLRAKRGGWWTVALPTGREVCYLSYHPYHPYNPYHLYPVQTEARPHGHCRHQACTLAFGQNPTIIPRLSSNGGAEVAFAALSERQQEHQQQGGGMNWKE